MQFKTLAFLTILPILFFTACDSKNEEKNEIKTEKTNKNLYQLTTTNNSKITITVENNKVIVKEYPNKVILLNFFATWCPPCKAEIPALINLQEKYSNDLQIISILVEENKTNSEINDFINEYKANYPVTNSEVNFKLTDALGEIREIPTMLLIAKDSNIFQKYVGLVPQEMMEVDIKKVLKK